MMKTITEKVTEHGTTYAVLFYFYLAFCIIPVSIYFILNLVSLNPSGILISAVWLGTIAYFFFKRQLTPLLITIFLQYPLQFLYIPFLEAFTPVFSYASPIYVFGASILYSLIMSYLFGKACPPKQFLSIGTWFSSALAVVFSANSFTIKLARVLSQRLDSLTDSSQGVGTIFSLYDAQFSSPLVEFFIAYVVFGGFLVYRYIKMGGSPKKLLWLLLPVVIFLILQVIVGQIMFEQSIF